MAYLAELREAKVNKHHASIDDIKDFLTSIINDTSALRSDRINASKELNKMIGAYTTPEVVQSRMVQLLDNIQQLGASQSTPRVETIEGIPMAPLQIFRPLP